MNQPQTQPNLSIQLLHGDCLELMKNIKNSSVDMVLCDLPYGVLDCEWDEKIDLEQMWEQYKRAVKPNGAIVFTATQPFATDLINSNKKWFKDELIFVKSRNTGFVTAKKMSMNAHENILIFYAKQPTYNPIKYHIAEQFVRKREYKIKRTSPNGFKISGKASEIVMEYQDDGSRYPDSVLYFKSEGGKGMHPTQKPLALFEYLIQTYSNEGDLVLDNCLGSGTTAVACQNLNRRCIGIEKDDKYFEMAQDRVLKNIKLNYTL